MFAKPATVTLKRKRRGAEALEVRTETLHALQDSDLDRVVGGTRKTTLSN